MLWAFCRFTMVILCVSITVNHVPKFWCKTAKTFHSSQSSSGTKLCSKQGASWVPPWILLAPDKFREMSMHTRTLSKKTPNQHVHHGSANLLQICVWIWRPGSFPFKSAIRRRWGYVWPCMRCPLHQILPWRPALEVQIQPVANSEMRRKGPRILAANSARCTQPHRFPWHVLKIFQESLLVGILSKYELKK